MCVCPLEWIDKICRDTRKRKGEYIEKILLVSSLDHVEPSLSSDTNPVLEEDEKTRRESKGICG